MNRKALGKGLEALIPDVAERDAGGTSVQMLEPGEVQANPEQPRTRFDEGSLRELAASMKVHGVVQPIVVREMPTGGYRLIVGERRLRAARMAGLEAVPAIVRDVLDKEALELANEMAKRFRRRPAFLEPIHRLIELLTDYSSIVPETLRAFQLARAPESVAPVVTAPQSAGGVIRKMRRLV